MKFEIFKKAACGLAVLLALATGANATTLGVTSTPTGAAWIRGDLNSAFGIFDTYPSTSYSGDSADSSSGITSLTLSQNSTFSVVGQGGGVFGDVAGSPGNDVINSGGNAYSFVMTGTTSFSIGSLYLSIKRPNSLTSFDTSFTPQLSLDGGITWISATSVATATGSGDTTGPTTNYSLTSWYWDTTGQNPNNSGSFQLNFGTNAGHRAIDGVIVDASAVPEPSTYALMFLGLGLVLFVHYRRREMKKATA